MQRGVPGRRILGLLAIALLAAGAGLAAHATGLLAWLERPAVDARFSLRGSEGPAKDIVVVAVDSDSLGVLPRHPFPRSLDARVVTALHAAGARLIVYDESFDRPAGPESESIELFEAARNAAPVVFATTLISPSGETNVLGGNQNLANIHARAAAAYLPVDPDGVLRHTVYEVNNLPSVAATVARELERNPPAARLYDGGWIAFRGAPGAIHNIPFARVLRHQFDPKQVRGKIVVVGATAPVLQDLHSTAAGSPMSGPEVQANAISTALRGFPLGSPSGAITVILIVGLALLAPLAGARLETLGVALVGLGALLLWTVSAQLAFDSGAVLDYSDPLAALVLGTGGAVLLGMWSDTRERRRLRMLFAADQSGVVDEVLQAPGERRLEPTAIIAGYRLERAIARGGMGVVYRATQLALDRPVAIKLIATEHARDPEFRERFKSESRIAASIEHANVIPVYEAGEDDGLLFIAMRLVDGVDLAQLMARAGPLEPGRVARLIGEVGGALDAAHAHGLVHRDVKPANVLLSLDEPEHAYLTDFGVAKYMGSLTQITRAGQWVGTLDYMAPEQLRGEDVDGRADIYALTAVMYRCLTGRIPFPRDNEAATLWAHMTASPPPPSRLRPDLPGALDVVIARGMAKDPDERFGSALALAHACSRALGMADSDGPEPSARAYAERADGAPSPPDATTLSD
jgi:serine/threonine-protein kinase